jgi:glycosyltransferase involved in cell wall biosynthesis
MASSRRPVTVCVITRDEENNLPRCLASVKFADEVVVLDSGSTDRTVELARAAGARVFVEPFRGWTLQKQRAIELASHEWVLSLDADEEVSPELAAAIQEALAPGAGSDGYALARKTWYAGRFIEHSGWWPEWRVRLFDRRRGRFAGRDPHDFVELQGTVGKLEGALFHYPYKDLAQHLAKIDAYTTTMARERAERGERCGWLDLIVRPPARFLRMFVLRRGFLDGRRGLVLAGFGAFYVFLKYAKLWELTREGATATAARPADAVARERISSSG